MKVASFFFFIFILVACSSNSIPDGIIAPNQMQGIIFDLLKADEFINGFAVKDSTVNIKNRRFSLYHQVFTIHHINKDNFYKSYQYYQQHPDKNKILFDSLYAVVSRKQSEVLTPKVVRPMNLTKPAHQPSPLITPSKLHIKK